MNDNSKTILIAGATGLVGSRLTELLIKKGYKVRHLSRHKSDGPIPTYVWDVNQGRIDDEALRDVWAVVNLAGANVSDKRWTEKQKQIIISSRVKSTRLLFDSLKRNKHSVKTYISASATGYYGSDLSKTFVEPDKPGNDFLSDVTVKWEHEADTISSLGIRVVKCRIGIVLSEQGGALAPISKTIKMLVGAPLGSGKQYVSWIHIDDLCNIFIKAIEDQSMSGVYNAVAPNPKTNKQLTKAIAEVLDKPLILPNVPAIALKIALGEMSQIVLEGAKVSSEKVENAGYRFQFPELDPALKDLLIDRAKNQ